MIDHVAISEVALAAAVRAKRDRDIRHWMLARAEVLAGTLGPQLVYLTLDTATIRRKILAREVTRGFLSGTPLAWAIFQHMTINRKVPGKPYKPLRTLTIPPESVS